MKTIQEKSKIIAEWLNWDINIKWRGNIETFQTQFGFVEQYSFNSNFNWQLLCFKQIQKELQTLTSEKVSLPFAISHLENFKEDLISEEDIFEAIYLYAKETLKYRK